MSRKYTANEMREMALVEESYGWDVVAKMLRQAADMMDGGYEYYVLQCRRCQTARSGEGYLDTHPPIGDDDICDRCEIAKRIRGNEDCSSGETVSIVRREVGEWEDVQK